ncbi:MAG: hypothetical protein GWP30_03555 [Actinobacteria bacterium]|nr:hypothetical protein [Actinomycetota bacterium]
MTEIQIEPNSFEMVFFDAEKIVNLASEVAEKLGLGNEQIKLRIDETSSMGRSRVESYEPIILATDGGAFENTQRPRYLGETRTSETIARLLMRIIDRRSPEFANAPEDDLLDLPLRVAWDTYTAGRLNLVGLSTQMKRRQYQFRNRHGFSDAADEAFTYLWESPNKLAWADIERISAGCRATLV